MKPTVVSIAWLGAFRIFFGLTMCVSMIRFIAYGWIDPFFVTPEFHFKYFGWSWLEPLPGPLMHGLFIALALLAFSMALGLFYRIASIAFFVGFAYLQLLDVTTYLNHYYLATLLAGLLMVSPANRVWSLDVYLRGLAPSAEVHVGWLWLFRFQIGVVYTFAGIAKVTSDWLIHHQPLSIWLGARTHLPLIGPWLAHDWAAPLMSWAGCLFDLSIPWLLLHRRTRPFAFVAVVGFHATTRLLFPIGMFPFIMVLSALVFFSPEWPLKWRLRRPVGEARTRFAGWPIAVAYCTIQLLLPLRFLAHDGNVLWDEQGMRFSWRVMVREKNGAVTFRVTDAEGRTREVPPRKYLTRVQEREMSSQPDLILQLAHHIRDEFNARGVGPVQVRAEALVSLNGRRAALLVDPEVDLAAVPDRWFGADYVLPEPSDQPPVVRSVALRTGTP